MEKYCYLYWFIKNKKQLKKITYYLDNKIEDQFLKSLFSLHQSKIDLLLAKLKAEGVEVITYVDELYPLGLKHLDVSPLVLCLKGDTQLLYKKCNLALVGSREIDSNLTQWLETEFHNLKGLVIISGGARGVDQEAHRNAIKNGYETIVVLPTGIFEPYPSDLKKWFSYDLCQRKVLFLSQFHPYERVKKYNFHPRNEVLVALSSRVLILQAFKRSGTMVTANYAADQGKEVYALSCSPWDEKFSGNKKLIEDGANQTIDLSLFRR